MKIRIKIILLVFVGWMTESAAQDLQFSQFYANVLYENPAFAGTIKQFRASLDYRHQWTNLQNPFNTAFLAVDYNLEKASSGVGLYFLNDRAGEGNLQTNEIAAQYSYRIKVNKTNVVALGIQPSFVLRSVDYNQFIFGDQLNDNGTLSGGSAELKNGNDNLSYVDISAGALYYNELFWAGIAAHHLNQPALSFDNSGDKLPMKISATVGGQIRLSDERNNSLYVIPAVNYKMQGFYDQLDLGVYVDYNGIVAGLWYRGVPVKKAVKGTANHDAIVVIVGVSQGNFSFGYSYDVGISKLTNTLQGAHELSVRFELGADKKMKYVPIPKF